jgi:hypothetical protein
MSERNLYHELEGPSTDLNRSKFGTIKRVFLILISLVGIAVIGFAFIVIRKLNYHAKSINPETYVMWLTNDRTVYENVDSIPVADLDWFAYAYNENKFVDAIPDSPIIPNVANEEFEIPAFKLDEDIYLITYKWVNESAGLVISTDENFENKFKAIDSKIKVKRISDRIYRWDLDL